MAERQVGILKHRIEANRLYIQLVRLRFNSQYGRSRVAKRRAVFSDLCLPKGATDRSWRKADAYPHDRPFRLDRRFLRPGCDDGTVSWPSTRWNWVGKHLLADQPRERLWDDLPWVLWPGNYLIFPDCRIKTHSEYGNCQGESSFGTEPGPDDLTFPAGTLKGGALGVATSGYD